MLKCVKIFYFKKKLYICVMETIKDIIEKNLQYITIEEVNASNELQEHLEKLQKKRLKVSGKSCLPNSDIDYL